MNRRDAIKLTGAATGLAILPLTTSPVYLIQSFVETRRDCHQHNICEVARYKVWSDRSIDRTVLGFVELGAHFAHRYYPTPNVTVPLEEVDEVAQSLMKCLRTQKLPKPLLHRSGDPS